MLRVTELLQNIHANHPKHHRQTLVAYLSLVFDNLAPSAPLLRNYSKCRGSFYAAEVSACKWVEVHRRIRLSAGNVLPSCWVSRSCRSTGRHHHRWLFDVYAHTDISEQAFGLTLQLISLLSITQTIQVYNNKNYSEEQYSSTSQVS